MNEIMPKGFENWTKYYQHKAKIAKIKQFGEYFLGVVLYLGEFLLIITSLMF